MAKFNNKKGSFEKKAIFVLKKLVTELTNMGIYRIQRSNTTVYPALPLSENDVHTLKSFYENFERYWAEEYADNEYAFMTGGIPLLGDNSELTLRVNPLTNTVDVQYSIFRNNSKISTLSYPLELDLAVELDRPLLLDILYFEALAEAEKLDMVYGSNVLYLEKIYPKASNVWARLKLNLMNELDYGYAQNVLSQNDIDVWIDGLLHDDVVLNPKDPQAMSFPTVSIYGGEMEIDDHKYRPRATIGLMEAAFMFRRDRYTPFMKMI